MKLYYYDGDFIRECMKPDYPFKYDSQTFTYTYKKYPKKWRDHIQIQLEYLKASDILENLSILAHLSGAHSKAEKLVVDFLNRIPQKEAKTLLEQHKSQSLFLWGEIEKTWIYKSKAIKVHWTLKRRVWMTYDGLVWNDIYAYMYEYYNPKEFYPISVGPFLIPIHLFLNHFRECEEHPGEIYTGECPLCRTEALLYYKEYSAKAEDLLPTYTKPTGISKKDRELLLGVELELENRTTHNLKVTNQILKDFAITKRDGSVASGMEIVSSPASITEQVKHWKPFFDELPKLMLENKSNCGMHVHVDRKALSTLQIGKINKFFYSNPKLIEKIGERSSHYAKINDKRDITYGIFYDNTEPVYYKRLKPSGGGKYQALNLEKARTIEVRIFASTTSWETFCKNLEFVQAVVDFTTPGKYPIQDCAKKASFLSHVKHYRKSYPNLYNFLKGIN